MTSEKKDTLMKYVTPLSQMLAKKFEKAHCIFQVSALDPDAPSGKVTGKGYR